MTDGALRLHGYWRSGAAYRVRIALSLKGLDWVSIPHDLRKSEQRAADYLSLAPQGLVPALEHDGLVLTQSSAILEWLEDHAPTPPLLPHSPADRAIVRGMAALVACDIHPLHNLRVLQALRTDFGATDAQVTAWIARWIGEGFAALETLVARHGDGFAFGDTPGLADCHLVPQLYTAERFHVDLSAYPRLVAAGTRAGALPAVARVHPSLQADADPA